MSVIRQVVDKLRFDLIYVTQNTMYVVLICLILLCWNNRLLLWILFVNLLQIRWWGNFFKKMKFPFRHITNNLIPILISIPINLVPLVPSEFPSCIHLC